MTIATVLLDLDGTLFDHRGSARAGLHAWLRTLGVEPTGALTAAWFDAERTHHAAWTRGEISFVEQRRRRLEEFLPVIGRPAGDDADLDEVFAGCADAYERAWAPFPDAAAALASVHDTGVRTAVLTNGTRDQQRAKLRACGLLEVVGPVLTSEELGVAKPDAAVFRLACERLGLVPHEVLHVGDDHPLDVVAARAAGLSAVHLDRGHGSGPLPRDVIVSLADLPAVLDDLGRRDGGGSSLDSM